jgi:2-amino-4-hydroxy-6-hydroxymethyldihydropteridine diphosphokinase
MDQVSIHEHQVCLLLGSNEQPEHNLTQALVHLQEAVTILRVSSVWETPPVGTSGPNFLNAAVMLRTPLEQIPLKFQVLMPLEEKLGRRRSTDKYAARPIDLDIIIFDGQVMDPTLWQYAHRAVPMAEIQPDIRSEDGRTLQEIAAQFLAEGSIRLRPDVVISIK